MNDETKQKSHETKSLQVIETHKKEDKRKNRLLEFITDFITGFSALLAVGLILFIVVPLLFITLKIGAAFVVPIAFLGAIIILIAMFGKFVRYLLIKKS
jgi:uncharacterized RDD family membrane protein YckC